MAGLVAGACRREASDSNTEVWEWGLSRSRPCSRESSQKFGRANFSARQSRFVGGLRVVLESGERSVRRTATKGLTGICDATEECFVFNRGMDSLRAKAKARPS